MLRLQDVSLMRGVRVLYSHATLLANPGERIGLVGENGCGKSSLLAAILGEVPLEAGEISAPALENIGHVAQDIDTVDEVAIDWVLSGHAPLMAAKKALSEARDDMSVASAHATLAELNEGAITAQAKIILHGLGFTGFYRRDDHPSRQGFLRRLAKPLGFGARAHVSCRAPAA